MIMCVGLYPVLNYKLKKKTVIKTQMQSRAFVINLMF